MKGVRLLFVIPLLVVIGCSLGPIPRTEFRQPRVPPASLHRLQGLASWYGGTFHGRKTANGETYDMHAMTAAHKTLPFDLLVRVRNLSNNQEVVVRINDRGPFVRGRVIDLSYSAASKLGLVGPGTAPVHITPLPRSGWEIETDYAVQIGAFASYANARRVLDELQQTRSDSRLQPGTLRGRTLWRVQFGDFSSLEAARQSLQVLRSRYPGAFIVAN